MAHFDEFDVDKPIPEFDDDKSFQKLEDRRVSFNDRHNYSSKTSSFYGDEWSVISPMTRHVFPSERSVKPVEETVKKIPRIRSRSFNDFIDTRDTDDVTAPVLDVTSSAAPTRAIESNGEKANNNDAYSQNGKEINGDKEDDMPIYMSVMYGAINCTIILPVIMSFGNIIYRDDAFIDYLPILIKLTLFSGMIHQLVFSCFSTLKFAVGSVQDAGLIFLSKMAHDMVQYCRANNHDEETMLATVTVGLSCAAAALGVGLIIIGKLGLASYVQMLPTCVVAGYLAYIGWFVGYSGLGIMAGVADLTPILLMERFVFVLPGVAGGAFIYIAVRKFRHVAVLPLCITFLLAIFYFLLFVTGSSIADATESGWIRKTEKAPAWYQTWDYIQIDKVAWGALPQLWLTWTGMLFVVALSSSLDVAAIELEIKKPLDYNRELRVVGLSNLLSGLTGGYTGSYIFSQTIFALRIGVKGRAQGFAIAFFCLLVIVIPFPILSYVPNFFYGSLLSMICIDLVYEWLWEFRYKVTTAEYLVGLSTFGLIQGLGVEYGLLAGIALYVVCYLLKIDVGELKQLYVEGDNSDDDGLVEIEEETTKLVTNGDDGTESYITF